ncbi:MAG: MBL fold metallo-hydrolase [Ruminococcaceae bacterium]|nr:MBL fold metallo-hydrolase [Oscillospiraceae bacterium]
MAKFCPLFSSSSGNSTYISSAYGSILVDCGVSFKTLKASIEGIGGDIGDIKALFITHEHIDHIKCINTLLKNIKIPLVASSATLAALESAGKIPAGTELINIDANQYEISDIAVNRFATSHDTDGSSGYVFDLGGQRVAVCTDLGVFTDEVRKALKGVRTLLIESNHDIEMLRRGPYPPELKLRIMSDKGHLSNNACAVELPKLLNGGTTNFVLGHLSQHNNLPTLALSTAKSCLMDIGAESGRDYIISAARPQNNEVIYL